MPFSQIELCEPGGGGAALQNHLATHTRTRIAHTCSYYNSPCNIFTPSVHCGCGPCEIITQAGAGRAQCQWEHNTRTRKGLKLSYWDSSEDQPTTPDERSAGVRIASLNPEIAAEIEHNTNTTRRSERTRKIIRNSHSSLAAGNINLFNSDGKCGGALLVLVLLVVVRMRTCGVYEWHCTRTLHVVLTYTRTALTCKFILRIFVAQNSAHMHSTSTVQ